jgi:hypothetical protein
VLVSLVAAIVVVSIGLNARTGRFDTAGTASVPAVVKAKSAQDHAGQEQATIR